MKKSLSAEKLHVRTFGGLTVYQKGSPIVVSWESRNSRLLFSYLVIMSNQWVHRDHLCRLLWQEEASRIKRANFNNAVSRLRRSVTAATDLNPVISQGSAYRLNFEAFTCDCDQFRADAVQGIRLVNRGEMSAATELLLNATDLYAETFFPEEPHDPFIAQVRHELSCLYAEVLKHLDMP